ncbi:phage minor structural protein [Planomicrobium soli]|uniref:Phage minor structural protein n=2 Tax=Planomicrobium soli TaxID=1176648 RepID=A0A2P8H7E6_9BACL|nr:phage minor structural protein [Planomicrobium soli]
MNRKRKVNGDKTLSFEVIPHETNAHAWDSVTNEVVADFLGEPYVIKQVDERSNGQRSTKQVGAVHRFFASMIDCYQEDVHSGSLTFQAALTMVFSKTLYGFTVVDTVGAKTLENFGADNCLALFQKVLESYGAEFRVVGKQVYLHRQIGADTDFQFRWRHNVKGLNKVENTSNLSTYIKGYGKLKELQDTLSNTSIPYTTRTGTYYTETGINKLATNQTGATFRFSFTGTGFNWRTIVLGWGGVWEFTIDKQTNVKISTYEDTSELSKEKTFEVIRGLEHKSHSVVATFKGKDSKSWYTSIKGGNMDPIGYLLAGNIIGVYRGLVGDEKYLAVAEYKSPNASLYPNPDSPDGLRYAGKIIDERYTTNATMLQRLKDSLQDEPELSITVDIAELGLNNGALNEGDRGYIIYEPMNIKVAARIVEIDETYKFIDKRWRVVKTSVTLSNSSIRLSDITTRMSETSKRIDRLFSGLEKVPFQAMDAAVAQATKALLSAQTELEFVNGIIARDKIDPNKLTVHNSSGFGISNDGGSSFGYAITGDGIVAEYIMAGMLRGMVIASESEDSLMWIQGGDIRLEAKSGQYLNFNSRGFTGFNQEGNILFQANQTWVTTAIVGTTTTNFYFSAYNEARAVNINGLPGDGQIGSYTYIPVRADGYKGNYLDVNTGTNATNLYLRPTLGGEVRVTAGGSTDIYYPLRAAAIHGTGFITTTTNAYIGADTELRVVSKVGATTPGTENLVYRDVRARAYYGVSLTADPGLYAYIGTDLGLRVTSRGLASSGPIYRDVTAASFTNGSRVETKADIKRWDADALEIIKNADLLTYFLKGDLEQGRRIRRYGLAIGGEWRTPEHIINGDGVDQYAMETTGWLAIQQLIKRLEKAENTIKELMGA